METRRVCLCVFRLDHPACPHWSHAEDTHVRRLLFFSVFLPILTLTTGSCENSAAGAHTHEAPTVPYVGAVFEMAFLCQEGLALVTSEPDLIPQPYPTISRPAAFPVDSDPSQKPATR
ncbi:hypothetical protein TREES_T100008984 [Tupaia chinensis]|uniref:Uncharacterized protein n=1 Tax=Tupaia chinensis TaxID=246437 RepID=L9KRA2_TUPCH|nr:hypothetical protein TREES_T100008984 [Tupaia chinensis]